MMSHLSEPLELQWHQIVESLRRRRRRNVAMLIAASILVGGTLLVGGAAIGVALPIESQTGQLPEPVSVAGYLDSDVLVGILPSAGGEPTQFYYSDSASEEQVDELRRALAEAELSDPWELIAVPRERGTIGGFQQDFD